MPEALSIEVLLALLAIAAVAGFVDAIAGGGGLLTIPALLWAGLPPVAALATNKAQAVFGSGGATWHFLRTGLLDLRALFPAVILTFVGSACGTLLVQRFDAALLARIVPLLLIAFALCFLFSPGIGRQDRRKRLGFGAFAILIGFSVGFYDGFFGPGTGTFFAAGFVLLLGQNLRHATAGAKLLNFTSNLAALIFFATAGQVCWVLGLSMGATQLAGAWLGSHMVVRHGAGVVRPLLVVVSLGLSVKLLLD